MSVWHWRRSFTVNQHRLRELSYHFRVGGVIFVQFVYEAFFVLKDTSNLCLCSKIDCKGVKGMVREVCRFPKACFLPREYIYQKENGFC